MNVRIQNLKFRLVWRWFKQSLSARAALFCIGAVGTSLLAVELSPYVPDEMAELLGGGAVDSILTILASSMLAVVTFSLSTLIASYSVAGASAPSRATSLIMRNTSAQTALSAFLGAFIFSIVSLVALSTKYYGPKGRVILFVMTIFVLGAVIWTVIRWIGQLSGIGQLPNVIAEIENAAAKGIVNQSLFFLEEKDTSPSRHQQTRVLTSRKTGFVQMIDIEELSQIADEKNVEIWLDTHSGRFVYPGAALAEFCGADSEESMREVEERIHSCFMVGHRRTFEDDPRFGLIVLSEIAQRALSPGINDPGTAIEIIGSQVRMLSKIHEVVAKGQERWWSKKLHLLPIKAEDLVDDAFQAISRDGAAIVEVGIFLQKALSAIQAFSEFAQAARDQAARSLEQGRKAIKSTHDVERLNRASSKNLQCRL